MRLKLITSIFLINLVFAEESSKHDSGEDKLTIVEKHAILIKEFIKILSEDDEGKKNHLTAPYPEDLPNMNTCYLKAFRQFQDHCCNYYDEFGGCGEFKALFHRACEADWLQKEVIAERIEKTCKENPHLTQKYPSTEAFTYQAYSYTAPNIDDFDHLGPVTLD